MKSRNLAALAFGLVVSTALSGAALAADVEAYTPHDWTGLYVGGHVGYGWVDLNGSYESEDAAPGEEFLDGDGEGTFDLDDDDFVIGLQAGYNLQINNIVFGIEGDVSFVNFDDEVSDGATLSFDTDFIATLRARGGIAMDNFLVYATVGAAWTDTNYEVDDGDNQPPNPTGDVDLDDIGLVVGGGAEYAFDENWSIRAEALYLIFDDKKDVEGLTNDSEVGDFIELEDIFIARVGVNFHF